MKLRGLYCLLVCLITLSLVSPLPVVAFDYSYRTYKSYYSEKTDDGWSRPSLWGPINDFGANCFYIHPSISGTDLLQDAHVFWYGQSQCTPTSDSSPSQLHYHRTNGIQWIEEVLPTTNIKNNWDIAMDIDQNGVSQFFYLENGQGLEKTIMYCTYNRSTSTWGVPVPISSSLRSYRLSGSVTANGLIFVSTIDGFWVGTANGTFNTTFPEFGLLEHFISPNNVIELISYDNSILFHEFSSDYGFSWSDRVQILEFPAGTHYPKIFKSYTGSSEPFFLFSRVSTSSHFMMKNLEGTYEYAPPIDLSSPLAGISSLQGMQVDLHDNIHIFGIRSGGSKSYLKEVVIDSDGQLVAESSIASSTAYFDYVYGLVNDQNTVQIVYVTESIEEVPSYLFRQFFERIGLILLGIFLLFGGFLMARRFRRN